METGGKYVRERSPSVQWETYNIILGQSSLQGRPPFLLTLDVCNNDGYCAAGRGPPQPLAEVNHVLKQLRAGTPLHTTYSQGKGLCLEIKGSSRLDN